MKELSLNILDVAENSVKAGANLTQILIEEEGNELVLSIIDDGCGMSPEVVRSVVDPFYTTRTTRKVGMGVPLLKLACEQTEGSLSIESVTEEADSVNHGTKVTALFHTDHGNYISSGGAPASSFQEYIFDAVLPGMIKTDRWEKNPEFYENVPSRFTPLGDVISTICTLIQGHPDTDFLFRHTKGDSAVELDTRQLREVLEDVPLSSWDVIQWIDSFLREQYDEFNTVQ